MIDNKRIDNDCTHCAHCVKHYANLYGTFQLVFGCMHCKNKNMSLRESNKRINNQEVCNYFEHEQLQIDERHKNIEYMLRNIAKKLQDVATILEEEKNQAKKTK